MSDNTKIVAVNDPELGVVYIEVDSIQLPARDGWENASNESDSKGIPEVEGRLSDALKPVRLLAKSALQALKDLDLEEFEIKTGVKFKVGEGKLFGILARAESEFSAEVTLKWKSKSAQTNSNTSS